MPPKPTWPNGHATKQCPRCNGTGMSRSAADTYAQAKTAGTTPIEHLKCGYCFGRGRIIDGAG